MRMRWALLICAISLVAGCKLHPQAFHPKAILAGDPWCERVCGPVDAGVLDD